ncbi:Roadblock/LC7 family protein [Chitinivibrio alkaliphilus]|uniref:Roadblock/LC7 family protein n=1 Tax=Chitinivibrio alkaliphilus ACht1 TaxID=1313304 RepID=U7D9R8_9BACT|nr:Roadblock/LC7 family protein [Chitinivibrio alkaliphilus]ERP39144.1 Roadblock/LC7 family protein [Chitinivibrio alkaliphilus ACht1]
MREDLLLRPDDIFSINLILTSILDDSHSEIILLTNKSGRLITFQAQRSTYDAISISALISGTFASSNSIANMINEPGFDTIHLEGNTLDIFVAQVDANNIVTTVFPKNSSAKKVKYALETRKTEFQKTLKKLYSHVENDPFLNINVSEYAHDKK